MAINEDERKAGIALRCNRQGAVLEVLCDELGIAHRLPPGESWTQVADEEDVRKASNLMDELRTRGAVFDWALNVPVAGSIATLQFGGIAQGDHVLIAAAGESRDAVQLLERFGRIDNEQSRALREALEKNAPLSRARADRDRGLFDEIGRLNNELVTLQRELAKKNSELQKLNEVKNQFLGMAAHDLRSALGGIISYSEFLLDEASEVLGEEHLEFLSIIHSSSEFLRKLVDDFLDIAIIESGKLRLDLEPVDLIALVEQNVALNRPLAEKKDIHLSAQHEESLPKMMLDSAKIDQVLNNLISNAVKYSYPGSTVEIQVAKRDPEGAFASDQQPESRVGAVISVRDYGQGIPPDELKKLFGLFERTTVRSTGGEKSSGLGLAIAKKIVEGHHGKIWAESQEGKGTTFHVLL